MKEKRNHSDVPAPQKPAAYPGHPAAPRQEGEEKKIPYSFRYGILIVLFAAVCLAYGISLFRITRTYSAPPKNPEAGYTVKTVKLQAVRGEIFDRNGKALVSNVYTYSLRLEYGLMSVRTEDQNADLAGLARYLLKNGLDSRLELPYCPLSGTYPAFSYDEEVLKSSVAASRLQRILSECSLGADADAAALGEALAQKYMLTGEDGKALYSDAEMTVILRIRYEAEAIRFAPDEPLTLLTDIGTDVITGIRELNIPGTSVSVSYSRVYNYPGYASHILGRVSRIYAEDAEKYTAMGYPINALVGTEGCELAFEEYLRGMDGEMKITYDAEGRKISEETVREPVAGKDVWLTIDIDLQIAGEIALEKNIAFVLEEAARTAGDLDGEDCDAGALVVEEVGTGAVLAICSYPTYDLTTYSLNYNSLLNNPGKPLFNRALEGTYAPGSTFKVGVAAAALTDHTPLTDKNGAVYATFTNTTQINTTGVYRFYEDYQPQCWLYSYGHQSHGKINVTRAIEVSCNCFFYELGRCLGIDRLNSYCAVYGLGQSTGIELYESRGILADRAYSESIGTAWTGGLTIQTAIGQGYNRFTPLQFAGYLATVVDGGTRYAAHLLHEVREFGGECVFRAEPTVASSFDMDASTYSTLISGMNKVVDENNHTVKAFDGFTEKTGISVGGKTGTAEVTGQSCNGVFIGFAPVNKPEITVSCVLERGAHGYNAAYAVRDVMEEYFKK